MDGGGRSLNPLAGWLILGGFVGTMAALLAWRLITGKKEPGYLALTEYWVYVDNPLVPATEPLMTRMISDNPHNRPGKPCIAAREGMLFTDIRLHIAAVLKRKNPTVFRPDLFVSGVTPTTEILELLARATGLIRIRYASEVRLTDNRHLQFLPHLADAITDLCGGLLVYDRITERLVTATEFKQSLADNGNAERPDFHIRVLWERLEEGFLAKTQGLQKVGRKEWRTDLQEADQEVVVIGLVSNAAHKVFRKPEETGPFEMEAYGVSFALKALDEIRDGFQLVELTRRPLT